MKRCACGENIYPYPNSTIHPKRCRKCEIARKLERIKRTKKKTNSKPKQRTQWQDKGTSAMLQYVQFYIVNPYIRLRDQTLYGVSISDNLTIDDAGHFYSIARRPGLRLSCQNIHGQSAKGNRMLDGDIEHFKEGLRLRYGNAYLEELNTLAKLSGGKKTLSRGHIIEVGETYIHLMKNRIWVDREELFNEFKLQLF